MNLEQRINLLAKLGNYLLENNDEWKAIKQKAFTMNAWFAPEFIDLACESIASGFLQKDSLTNWAENYRLPAQQNTPQNIGIVMAGNIPMVGFHDFLCVFVSGHRQTIKLSSKDELLLPFLVDKLIEWNDEAAAYVSFALHLKGCDAYIATGSNNSSRYFEFYFQKYPSIIRRNRTSAAIINGDESKEELELLCKDLMQYFGLGCRNVTKIFVPENYDFVPMINVLKQYEYYLDFHKYKHNYDYQLAILLLSNKFYMSSNSLLLLENDSLFSPISQVNYSFYTNKEELVGSLKANEDVQCIISSTNIPFGSSQQPSLYDYADGVDTMHFLINL
ncbi:acyl-CoA reductase [Arachidicoccus sp.]|uniref:acyl-CoA reductase n=1 Tax=Arachidicoccus sp. TaxID=1872624 RepID=UPI003D1E1E55